MVYTWWFINPHGRLCEVNFHDSSNDLVSIIDWSDTSQARFFHTYKKHMTEGVALSFLFSFSYPIWIFSLSGNSLMHWIDNSYLCYQPQIPCNWVRGHISFSDWCVVLIFLRYFHGEPFYYGALTVLFCFLEDCYSWMGNNFWNYFPKC